jgi:hypothetical protein
MLHAMAKAPRLVVVGAALLLVVGVLVLVARDGGGATQLATDQVAVASTVPEAAPSEPTSTAAPETTTTSPAVASTLAPAAPPTTKAASGSPSPTTAPSTAPPTTAVRNYGPVARPADAGAVSYQPVTNPVPMPGHFIFRGAGCTGPTRLVRVQFFDGAGVPQVSKSGTAADDGTWAVQAGTTAGSYQVRVRCVVNSVRPNYTYFDYDPLSITTAP